MESVGSQALSLRPNAVFVGSSERRFSNASFGANGSIGPGDHRPSITLSNTSTPFPSPPVQSKTQQPAPITTILLDAGTVLHPKVKRDGGTRAAVTPVAQPVDVSQVKLASHKTMRVIKPSADRSPSPKPFTSKNGTKVVERSTSPFVGEEYPGARIHSNTCTLL